ncbi:MAG TPA: hypothetical protein VE734_03340 [Terriglobales bacterium]|nr:hypothetical protein [Terriglobales bacterium]
MRFLRDRADELPRRSTCDLLYVATVNFDGSAVCIVEARQKISHGRFPRAAWSHKRCQLTGLDFERDLMQGATPAADVQRLRFVCAYGGWPIGLVGKRDAAERNPTTHVVGPQLDGIGCILNFDRQVKVLENAVKERECPLDFHPDMQQLLDWRK